MSTPQSNLDPYADILTAANGQPLHGWKRKGQRFTPPTTQTQERLPNGVYDDSGALIGYKPEVIGRTSEASTSSVEPSTPTDPNPLATFGKRLLSQPVNDVVETGYDLRDEPLEAPYRVGERVRSYLPSLPTRSTDKPHYAHAQSNQQPPVTDDPYADIIEAAKPKGRLSDLTDFAKQQNLTVGSTTGGHHNRGSKHYRGEAIDIHNSGQMTNEQVASLSQTAIDYGLKVRDERQRPKGQKVWGGPHVHIETDDNDPYKDILSVAAQPSSRSAYASRAGRQPTPIGRRALNGVETVDAGDTYSQSTGLFDATRPRINVPNLQSIVTEAREHPDPISQRNVTIREQVTSEQHPASVRGKLGKALTAARQIGGMVTGQIPDAMRPEEDVVNEETNRRIEAANRANTPEMINARRKFGALDPITRTAASIPATLYSDVLKTGAGVIEGADLLTAGGVSKLGRVLGVDADQIRSFLNTKGDIFKESQSTPLQVKRDLTSLITNNEQLEPVERSRLEKVGTMLGEMGVGIGELILTKKATGLSMPQVMGLETALKTSDLPLRERQQRVADATAMGAVLEGHLSKPASAALFGAPTAIQGAESYLHGNMSAEDAVWATLVQGGVGAWLGGKPKPQGELLTKTLDVNDMLAEREARVTLPAQPKDARINDALARELQRTGVTHEKQSEATVSNQPEVAAETLSAIEQTIQQQGAARDRVTALERELAQWQQARGRGREGQRRIQSLQDQLKNARAAIEKENQAAAQQLASEQSATIEQTRYSPTPRFDEWVENESGQRVNQLAPEELAALRQRYRAEFANAPTPPALREMPPLDRVVAEPTEQPHHSATQNRRVRNVSTGKRGQFAKGKAAEAEQPTDVPAPIPEPVITRQSNEPLTERRVGSPRTAESDVTAARASIERLGGTLTAHEHGGKVKWRVDWDNGASQVFRDDQSLIAAVRQSINESVKLPEVGKIGESTVTTTPLEPPASPSTSAPSVEQSTAAAPTGILPESAAKWTKGHTVLEGLQRGDQLVDNDGTVWTFNGQHLEASDGRVKLIRESIRAKENAGGFVADNGTIIDAAEMRPVPKAVGETAAPSYPMADRGEWYSNADYQQRGARLTQMTPDEFLAQAKPLELDEVARDNIDDLKRHIESGRTLDPAALYADGKTDGRHRAIAAKELGIKNVPVLDFRNATTAAPVPSTVETPRQAERATPKTLEAAGLEGGADRTYDVVTNEASIKKANDIIDAHGVDLAVDIAKQSDGADKTALGLTLIKKLQDAGKHDQAVDVASDLARELTKQGQTIQAVAIVNRLSPERAVVAAEQMVTKSTNGNGHLTPEYAKQIAEHATKLQDAEARITDLQSRIAKLQTRKSPSSSKPRVGTLQQRLAQVEAEARQRIAERQAAIDAGELKLMGAGASPSPHFNDYVIIGAAKLAQRGMSFARWSSDMVKEFGDAIKPHLRAVYTKSFENYRNEQRLMQRESQERGATKDAAAAGVSITNQRDMDRLIAQRIQARKDAASSRRELAKIFNDLTQSRWQKAKGVAVDTLSVPRALKASVDLSAPRQAAMWMVSHPVQGAKLFFGKQLKAMREVNYDKFVDQLESDPDYQLMRKSGLTLASVAKDRDPYNITAREEAFASRLAGKIPGVSHSERAYTTFIDTARSSWFKQLARQAESVAQSKGSTVTPEQYQAIANFVNLGTGRGNLGRGQISKIAPFLNAVLFAPRYAASKIQVFDPRVYSRLPAGARGPAVRAAVGYFGAMATTALLLKYGLNQDVSLNPESSEFMKLRVGNTRYDLTFGQGQYFVLAARLMRNAENKRTGQKDAYGKSFMENVDRFVRYKYSPPAAFARNVWEGKNAIGEPTTAKREATELITPLFLSDLYNAYQQEGVTGLAKTAPGFVGVGVSTYPDRYGRRATKELDNLKLSLRGIRKDPDETFAEFKQRQSEHDKIVGEAIENLVTNPRYGTLSNDDKREQIKMAVDEAVKSMPKREQKEKKLKPARLGAGLNKRALYNYA